MQDIKNKFFIHFIKWEIGIYLWKRMYLFVQKHKYTFFLKIKF